TDETRYLLTGVCFDLASGFIVATDGFRLHKAAVDTCKCPSFILLKRAAGLLAKYGADGITFAQNKASATLVGGTFITRLIEGQYPDFHSVWPDISTYEKVHFKAKDFLELIPGVLPVSNSFEIEMTINGRIDIKAESDSGTYNWHVEADSTLDGVPKVMSINSKFLVDAIKSYGDSEKIDMSFPRDYGAIIVNEQALIMPIRH
ncbi:MAG TPA: DNA polymerase III subunit beta, partial [Syntrophorhabdaceae bacterium]|nr:DNA polymerase III subunit beta [Syntrophorhabdaceae bacterium]